TVWPSAGALATKAVPMFPPAPGLFSTTTDTSSAVAICWAYRRVSVSPPPPGEKGATKVTGVVGQVSARAAAVTRAAEANSPSDSSLHALFRSGRANAAGARGCDMGIPQEQCAAAQG